MVMQRTATPCTPVRFRPQPPSIHFTLSHKDPKSPVYNGLFCVWRFVMLRVSLDVCHIVVPTGTMISAESRKFMESLMGSSRSGEGTDDNLYLSGFSGDKVTRDRVGSGDGSEELVMYKPCLNVTVMTQPDKYLALANHKELRSSGLIARSGCRHWLVPALKRLMRLAWSGGG